MSFKRFPNGDHKHFMINGRRPTPLKLKQESYTIHKQRPNHRRIKAPIVIYTRSPEVIKTKPHDFMALVQKLTGDSGSTYQEQQHMDTLKQDVHDKKDDFSNDHSRATHKKGNESRSPVFIWPSTPFVGDIPLVTPNSNDYFSSPQRFYRFFDVSTSASPTLSSGSILQLMEGLYEY